MFSYALFNKVFTNKIHEFGRLNDGYFFNFDFKIYKYNLILPF